LKKKREGRRTRRKKKIEKMDELDSGFILGNKESTFFFLLLDSVPNVLTRTKKQKFVPGNKNFI